MACGAVLLTVTTLTLAVVSTIMAVAGVSGGPWLVVTVSNRISGDSINGTSVRVRTGRGGDLPLFPCIYCPAWWRAVQALCGTAILVQVCGCVLCVVHLVLHVTSLQQQPRLSVLSERAVAGLLALATALILLGGTVFAVIAPGAGGGSVEVAPGVGADVDVRLGDYCILTLTSAIPGLLALVAALVAATSRQPAPEPQQQRT